MSARRPTWIDKEGCVFIVGGLAAHVQMAINEQTKKSKVLYVSTSQSDEISAKPDGSPITFHEALNPTITCRAFGSWVTQNLGKKWWIIYADYAWRHVVAFAILLDEQAKLLRHRHLFLEQ